MLCVVYYMKCEDCLSRDVGIDRLRLVEIDKPWRLANQCGFPHGRGGRRLPSPWLAIFIDCVMPWLVYFDRPWAVDFDVAFEFL